MYSVFIICYIVSQRIINSIIKIIKLSVLVADQTGSGKTLAYLLPVIERLIEASNEGRATSGGRVRALVLCPTTELAVQATSPHPD